MKENILTSLNGGCGNQGLDFTVSLFASKASREPREATEAEAFRGTHLAKVTYSCGLGSDV